MTYISGTHLCIYISGIVLVIFLLGLFGSKYLTFDNSNNPFIVENLEVPSVSSTGDVSAGASELYGWGYTPVTKPKSSKVVSRKCSSCENNYMDNIDLCVTCHNGNKDCRFADITQNVDIDKYVLKSSVPSCPNLSEYAKKNMVPPYPFNKDEWIRKNEIPPCFTCPDMRDYIKKSDLPAQCLCGRCGCGKCGRSSIKCPLAPVCPVCPLIPLISNEDNIYNDKPSSISNYPQTGGNWTPKLSELNEGFISPNKNFLPCLSISRGMDAMPRRN
jgi:hypothetical protein